MMPQVFAEKLNTLPKTVDLLDSESCTAIANALAHAQTHGVANAVGCGGSSVTAEFIAWCAKTAGLTPFQVLTPMAFVSDPHAVRRPSWLFSARGTNPDVLAAFELWRTASGDRLEIVTNNAGSELGQAGEAAMDATVHALPMAEAKDGFLATHSLVGAAAHIVGAFDSLVGGSSLDIMKGRLANAVQDAVQPSRRCSIQRAFSSFEACDQLLVLHDPDLLPAAALIETSCWEAGLCTVQRTDFRNFAHGRHVGLGESRGDAFVLALTSETSESIWKEIRDLLPQDVEHAHLNWPRAGRVAGFEALIYALIVVESIGLAKGMDPSNPDVPDFGRQIYAQEGLLRLARARGPGVVRKIREENKIDPVSWRQAGWDVFEARVRQRLEQAHFGGVVLDYDGTVVSTENRCEPPEQEILAKLIEIVEHGMTLAFASGRGGSLGETLRPLIPRHLHDKLVVGYYNGCLIRPLSVDIESIKPQMHPAIEGFLQVIRQHPELVHLDRLKPGSLHVRIPLDALTQPDPGGVRSIQELAKSMSAADGVPEIALTVSEHSIDVFPAESGKRNVVEHVKDVLTNEAAQVLCIGDSGHLGGNDHELLEGPYGLSVLRVCHRPNSCWNLLPEATQGHEGLLAILNGLVYRDNGTCIVDISRIEKA